MSVVAPTRRSEQARCVQRTARPSASTALVYRTAEPAFSSVQVVNEAGQRVDRADGAVDPSSPALLRTTLVPLSPGRYQVIWRVVSVDTHVTAGDFAFRLAP